MRADFVIHIDTTEDLQQLPPPQLLHAIFRIDIGLPHLTAEQRRAFELRMKKALEACGCREGHIALVTYITATALLITYGRIQARSAGEWLALLGGLVLATVLGKAVGLAIGRFRLRHVIVDLRRTLD